MSGHSKWSTIKRKKGATDARRGRIFTRLAREITLAAREGGGDINTNFKLRLAVDKAKAENMPKDNISRAIKRGTGEGKDSAVFEEVVYEGYAVHGIALMIECVTDNRNRAIADVRHALNKHGGSVGAGGSVTWQFERKAYFAFPQGDRDQDTLFEMAVEAGADDILFEDGNAEIFGAIESFKEISDALQAAGIAPTEAQLLYEPSNPMSLAPSQAAAVLRTIEMLEDSDDVQNVYSNLDITDEALALMES